MIYRFEITGRIDADNYGEAERKMNALTNAVRAVSDDADAHNIDSSLDEDDE